MEMKLKNGILTVALFLLVGLFLVSLFKNIKYPLLWNDEAETAMYATRILHYGYPKIHDGKNVVYLLELPNKRLGMNEKIDAWTCLPWVQYYFAAIGAFFAEKVDDIYSKTAVLRIPFALIGFMGLVIIALLAASLFRENLTYMLIFLVLFALFELLSISLVLHLREVRSYSINIFLSACLFYSYVNYTELKKIGAFNYAVSTTLILVLLFNNISISYFNAAAAIGLFNSFEFFKKRNFKNLVISMLPLFISFTVIIPLLLFFDVFHISREFEKFFGISSGTYLKHTSYILNFFKKYEFLHLALAAKIVLTALRFYLQGSGLPQTVLEKVTSVKQKLFLSDFLSLYFVVHVLAVAKIPYPTISERYIIGLQPVLIIILLLDIFIIFELVSGMNHFLAWRILTPAILLLMSILFIANLTDKIEFIKNHLYELSHQYKGPLDFVIPYIKHNYKNTDSLTIATNYEECSYMYYLNSKVIIGYVGNNLMEDMKADPDIIILRKKLAYTNKQEIFAPFFERNNYVRMSFPVFDYFVNNIPETSLHLFKTKMAENDSQCLDIYLKTTMKQ
jgi:hypothetical protein